MIRLAFAPPATGPCRGKEDPAPTTSHGPQNRAFCQKSTQTETRRLSLNI